jgi:hypothetical protein
MKNDSYGGWDATGGYLLAYAMPLKKSCSPANSRTSPRSSMPPPPKALILDGRGWTNKDRNSAYDKLESPDQLLERLGSWSPTVRERAAMAIARRKGDKPVAALVKCWTPRNSMPATVPARRSRCCAPPPPPCRI